MLIDFEDSFTVGLGNKFAFDWHKPMRLKAIRLFFNVKIDWINKDIMIFSARSCNTVSTVSKSKLIVYIIIFSFSAKSAPISN